MGLFAVTIFLSAFLLFQVQPVIAKAILPWFGGSAGVWSTCLLFFQVTLLAGYFYTHGIISRLSPKQQRLLHGGLLLAALATLPIYPTARWKPTGAGDPTWLILALLAVTIGLPYFVLSTTGPLIQAWYSQSRQGAVPYRLFALSNLGSMLGLLTYPVLVEPRLTVIQQSWTWSVGFLIFAIVAGLTARRSYRPTVSIASSDQEGAAPPRRGDLILWVLLAMCPSMLLLAVTNYLTEDVASIPFLWILPLALYLLSFILCFDAQGWYRRDVFFPLLAAALGGMAYLQWTDAQKPGMRWLIAIFALSSFVVYMFCHGELARQKPHPRYLTSFYLMLSIGGALGGLFVALLAPNLFNSKYEFPIALVLCGLLVVVVLLREGEEGLPGGLLGWSGIALLTANSLMVGWLIRVVDDRIGDTMLVQRNFYGELRVRQYNNIYDWGGYRTLIHGLINHGEQWTHPARRHEASTYYCASSGVGRVMSARVVGSPQRVGIIGLGTGSLALYARPGDAYRFYDINPLVQKIANTQFTYLKDAEAQVEVVLGDARLSLERESSQGFDILVLDAFSGDSIPIHLLTKEAMALYLKHLRPDGTLAVHISNHYLDLKPVVAGMALAAGWQARAIDTEDDEQGSCFGTTWVIVSGKPALFERSEFAYQTTAPAVPQGFRPWSDDYSSLYSLLR